MRLRVRRSLLEGTFEWAALVGPRGLPQRGPCPVCALKQDVFSFGFLQVLSRISPVVFRGPSGLSPTVAPEHLRVRRPGSRRC
jgi:hypothetical protein